MAAQLRSIVFKTKKLRETEEFFCLQMGLTISESSVHHFVLQGKDVRILFMHAVDDLHPEVYFSVTPDTTIPAVAEAQQDLTILTDPNNIKIIIAYENVNHQ